MKFTALPIPDAWSIELTPHVDERGAFARTWCADAFAAHGIVSPMVQASVSRNRRAGTLRGMHFARLPAREGKLVRCSAGSVHDVILDLRPDSPTFGSHHALELDSGRGNGLYVPPGVAHGFQALADDSEVFYMMTEAYRPDCAAGVHHADPAFGIRWPLPVSLIADRDLAYPHRKLDEHRAWIGRLAAEGRRA